MTNDVQTVAVVGAGALGTTAAHDLATAGVEVTLYERGEVASGASGRAAGIAYDAFAEDVDAAVADRALDRFESLAAEGAIEFTTCPYCWFAREGDDRHARAIERSVERMQANDRDIELLTAADLAERFPAIRTDVEIGAVTTRGGHLDPESYVRAMADRARDAGVTVSTDTRVSLDLDGERPAIEFANATKGTVPAQHRTFDALVVAAGAHTPKLLSEAGQLIPAKPYRVQALTTGPVDPVTSDDADHADDDGDERERVPMTYDATEGFYLRPRDGGLLVGDGTEEREFDPDDYDPTGDETFVDTSRERVAETLGVEVTVERAWAGLCTATPDRDPLLGPVDADERVFAATGWHGHGFMRAPALGERVAEQLLGGDGIDAFDPRRFDGDESFAVVEGMTVEES